MWVAYDQIRRWRIYDFTSNDIYKYSFRFLIAIPLGISFAAAIQDPVGIPFAFFLGTFPTDTLLTYGRRIVSERLKIGEKGGDEKSELEQLQCLNKKELERFHNEGITNILQLAYSNPIELTLRTNFDFNYIIDCISQSLLWIYVGNDIEKLRLLGLRGAQEVCAVIDFCEDKDHDEKATATACLEEVSRKLNLPIDVVKFTLLQVSEDPYSKFICDVWK